MIMIVRRCLHRQVRSDAAGGDGVGRDQEDERDVRQGEHHGASDERHHGYAIMPIQQ